MLIIFVAKTSTLRTLLWTSMRLPTVMVSFMFNLKFIYKDFALYSFSYWDYLVVCELSKLIFPDFFFDLKGLVANPIFSALILAIVRCLTQVILHYNFLTIFITMNHPLFLIFFDCFIMQMVLRTTVITTKNTFINTFY